MKIGSAPGAPEVAASVLPRSAVVGIMAAILAAERWGVLADCVNDAKRLLALAEADDD